MSSLQSIVWPAVTEAPDAIFRLKLVGFPLLRDMVKVTVKQLTLGVPEVAFT